MGGWKLDLSGHGKLVPEGHQQIAVSEVTLRQSAAGSEYLHWWLTIDGGEHDGQSLVLITSLRVDMLDMLAKALRAVGVEIDEGELELETDKDGVIVTPELEGRRAVAIVVHDEWQGETRAKVRRLVPQTD